jgi:hypothetical protein
VIRGREGVAAISGLPGVLLTGVADGSPCVCTQQKENITILGLNKHGAKTTQGEVPLTLDLLKYRVLRRIFGPKRDETGGGENCIMGSLYSLPSIIRIIKSRRIGWAGHVVHMGARNTYRFLVRKPEGKRPLGRPRWRWVDNTKMDIGEIVWGGVDWIGLAQDKDTALLNVVMNPWVP